MEKQKTTIGENARNLLTVKSLVTLALTLVFAYMAARGEINRDFMTIYAVIISFYFGTQKGKSDSTATATATATSGGTATTEEADTDAV